MAANLLKYFLPMTGFLHTKIAPAIKPTPQNKGQNVDTNLSLMARTYGSYARSDKMEKTGLGNPLVLGENGCKPNCSLPSLKLILAKYCN